VPRVPTSAAEVRPQLFVGLVEQRLEEHVLLGWRESKPRLARQKEM
jgi:hypothetical protein